jgi:di/tripeptidase
MKRENNINLVKGLKPDRLWYYFAEICSIPHPSRKEEKIAKYLIDVAKSLKLDYKIDTTGNIVIYKINNTLIIKSLYYNLIQIWYDANKD